jgi:N-acetyl-1-D-myo-inositol-2-amino-2-deoxy-alpha-D-glucopyranoside deacetylase
MRRILAVFAHPDDEQAIAGTLARYARDGAHVTLVCATKGEAGEISDPSLASKADLGNVRAAELRCACDLIGISELHFLGYYDSGMMSTTDNERPTAFIQADPDEVREKLVRLIRTERPDLLITFEPDGWYGHPDHIAAGRYASEAFQLAADPGAFANSGMPWQTQRLFHAAILRQRFKRVVDYAISHDIPLGGFEDFPYDAPDPLADQITHALDVRDLAELKAAAMRCHKTQFGEDSLFRRVPSEVMAEAMGYEDFVQVSPAPGAQQGPLPDLFQSAGS